MTGRYCVSHTLHNVPHSWRDEYFTDRRTARAHAERLKALLETREVWFTDEQGTSERMK